MHINSLYTCTAEMFQMSGVNFLQWVFSKLQSNIFVRSLSPLACCFSVYTEICWIDTNTKIKAREPRPLVPCISNCQRGSLSKAYFAVMHKCSQQLQRTSTLICLCALQKIFVQVWKRLSMPLQWLSQFQWPTVTGFQLQSCTRLVAYDNWSLLCL